MISPIVVLGMVRVGSADAPSSVDSDVDATVVVVAGGSVVVVAAAVSSSSDSVGSDSVELVVVGAALPRTNCSTSKTGPGTNAIPS